MFYGRERRGEGEDGAWKEGEGGGGRWGNDRGEEKRGPRDRWKRVWDEGCKNGNKTGRKKAKKRRENRLNEDVLSVGREDGGRGGHSHVPKTVIEDTDSFTVIP